jgi:1-aminocyclopropane-1-carboxylate deaminase/D-cysteine desulfhydrase-like pyridoxal-dependent ACC family enzyme
MASLAKASVKRFNLFAKHEGLLLDPVYTGVPQRG